MLARVLRPSARQVRSDFEKNAFTYGGQLDEDSSLKGLGIAANEVESKRLKNAIESQDATISELKKRVSQQESISTLLQRELAESTALQQLFERQKYDTTSWVALVKNSETESGCLEPMDSYMSDISGRIQTLTSELSEGWAATQSLADLAAFQKSQLMFNHELLGILRDRIISNIPHVAGAIFTSPQPRSTLTAKKPPRNPPKSTLTTFDESPEIHAHAEQAYRIRSLEISLLPLLALHSDRSLKRAALALLRPLHAVHAEESPKQSITLPSPLKVSVLSVCGVTLPVRPKTATIRSVPRHRI